MEDEDDEQQIDSHHGKHPEIGKKKSDHHQCKSHCNWYVKLKFCVDSEKESFLPKSPQHSHPTLRDVRHWIPSRNRHVVITPEMLRQQSNLDDPYNPNPFDNDANADENGVDGELLSSKDRRGTGGTIASQTAGRRKTAWAKIRYSILNRGYIPLVLRFVSLIFSILAVILAVFITRTSVVGGVATRPSTVMAFVVNGISVFYLPWAARVFRLPFTRIGTDFCRMNISDGRLGFALQRQNCEWCYWI